MSKDKLKRTAKSVGIASRNKIIDAGLIGDVGSGGYTSNDVYMVPCYKIGENGLPKYRGLVGFIICNGEPDDDSRLS